MNLLILIFFQNSVDHQKQLKKHDKIQLKCSVNGCDRLRNCRVCKIFDEKPLIKYARRVHIN